MSNAPASVRRITVIIHASTHARLEEIARRTNKPLTEVVRRGMRMVIRDDDDKGSSNVA